MKQYNVTGMSCAACSARVEKAVGKVPGVTSCSVSLLTNSMGVEGTASPEAVIKAVREAGYGASEKGAAYYTEAYADEDENEAPVPADSEKAESTLGLDADASPADGAAENAAGENEISAEAENDASEENTSDAGSDNGDGKDGDRK